MTAGEGWRGVVSAGRIYCDLVFTGIPGMPRLGHEVFAEGMAPVLGGGAYITAAHIAACGRPVALLSRYGTDALSRGVEDRLAVRGLELGFLERHASAGPQVTVAMATVEDRAFLSRRAGHALPVRYSDALQWVQATHLHIAEYATLAEYPHLVRQARDHGHTVSLDPSWDEALIRDPGLLAGAAGVDVFLPNAEEALAITRQATVADALGALAAQFPLVAIKQGAHGASVMQGKRRIAQIAPKVRVVDTTCAGDVFNASFLHARLDSCPIEYCLARAIDAGSAAVQAAGGTAALAQSGDSPSQHDCTG